MTDQNTEYCRERILSNDYEDFLVPKELLEENGEFAKRFCPHILSGSLAVVHVDREFLPPVQFYSSSAIPRLYGLADTTSMEASGILRAREQPVLGLRGSGVLIGIVDTGIDWRHPAFLNQAGRTRILRIWDQTLQDGNVPEGFSYGSEYTEEDINRALLEEAPESVLPSEDENGHGTFIASVAAGSELFSEEFTGAAPGAFLAVVRLKPAKQYLRDYYLIREDAPAYQETDIMAGIRYLLETAERLGLPLALLVGLETSLGDHAGNGALEQMLDAAAARAKTAVVTAAGNEANRAHHYFGKVYAQGAGEAVELRIPSGERGLSMELWAGEAEVYSVQLRSPAGESTGRVSPRLNQNSVFQFTMEKTVVYVDYQLIERESGSLVIRVRLADPTPGIWTLEVYNEQYTDGSFHIWLPVEGFLQEGTQFLRPDPDTTITMPAAAEGPIAFGAYDHRRGSLYIHSGRGYAEGGAVKPELVAPGTDIYGAVPGGGFGRRSGTSLAAAHGAGAAALLLEWGIVQGNYRGIRTRDIKSLMIRGAERPVPASYPNRAYGYGAPNLFGVFTAISL